MDASMEDKIEGVHMLTNFLHVLKHHFAPYIQDAFKVLLPLCRFYMSDEVCEP